MRIYEGEPMYFNRFDICEAWYIFLSQFHEGQNSKKYRKLSKLLTYFHPRQALKDESDLNDNARMIYTNLALKEM